MSPIFLGAAADSKEGLLEAARAKRAGIIGENRRRL
jgi:hypothetical protein